MTTRDGAEARRVALDALEVVYAGHGGARELAGPLVVGFACCSSCVAAGRGGCGRGCVAAGRGGCGRGCVADGRGGCGRGCVSWRGRGRRTGHAAKHASRVRRTVVAGCTLASEWRSRIGARCCAGVERTIRRNRRCAIAARSRPEQPRPRNNHAPGTTTPPEQTPLEQMTPPEQTTPPRWDPRGRLGLGPRGCRSRAPADCRGARARRRVT
ncbi:hypothetical protein ER308_20005 [Egibacter rhizosphaerae]|uniref:Uncharacterized protein n=1 Tax=Egibacter rhizosphaerae TaxID=1670831 RepID=A0A411YKB3_9ACTN|nr:hypothetical protein ER308_20005 [Egibacter rhizosphaerae]